MMMKTNFERSSQNFKGGSAGVRKEDQQGTHLEIFIVGPKHRKNSILEVAFLLSSLFPGNPVTIILHDYPPSSLSRGSD